MGGFDENVPNKSSLYEGCGDHPAVRWIALLAHPPRSKTCRKFQFDSVPDLPVPSSLVPIWARSPAWPSTPKAMSSCFTRGRTQPAVRRNVGRRFAATARVRSCTAMFPCARLARVLRLVRSSVNYVRIDKDDPNIWGYRQRSGHDHQGSIRAWPRRCGPSDAGRESADETAKLLGATLLIPRSLQLTGCSASPPM